MQVFLQIVAFSLQTDGSGRPVLTKGKRPKLTLSQITCSSSSPFWILSQSYQQFDSIPMVT